MKKQIILSSLLFAVLLTVAMSSTASAWDGTIEGEYSNWVPKYEGIWYSTYVDSGSTPLRAYAVKIDTEHPDVAFYVTAGTGSSDPNFEMPVEKTSDFLDRVGVQVAINANFGDGRDDRPGYPNYTNACGEVKSAGTRYSAHNNNYKGKFFCYSGNEVYCLNHLTESQAGKVVSGRELILSNGVNVASSYSLNPLASNYDPDWWYIYHVKNSRTGIGVSADNRFVYFVVLDGQQAGWSDGLWVNEFADMLKQFGCDDAALLDGGGSSVLCAQWDYDDIVSSPDEGEERKVGVNIGADSPAYNPRHSIWTVSAGTSPYLTRRYWTQSGGWTSSWSEFSVPSGSRGINPYYGTAVACRTVERYHVFVVGNNHKIYKRWYHDGTWSSWSALPDIPSGRSIYSPIDACAASRDRMDVAFVADNGRLYRIAWNNGSWDSTWTDHGGDFEDYTKPAIASWGPGRIDIFAQKDSGGIYHKYSTNNGSTWSVWSTVEGNPYYGLDVCSEEYGKYIVAYYDWGTDDIVYRIYNGSSMSGETNLGGWFDPYYVPVISSFEKGRRAIYGRIDYGTIYKKEYNNGEWDLSWTNMGSPSWGGSSSQGQMCASSWSNTPGTHQYVP